MHDHNEKQKAGELVSWLEQGLNIALVSDAGTPLISDPGYAVVNMCRDKGVKVSPIPGACAAIAAATGELFPDIMLLMPPSTADISSMANAYEMKPSPDPP